MSHFQAEKEHGVEDPYHCLSDFVAPLDSNIKDYVGCFAVSIMGAEEMAKKYAAKRHITPLHPNISMHILHTDLYTFLKVLNRRICFIN